MCNWLKITSICILAIAVSCESSSFSVEQNDLMWKEVRELLKKQKEDHCKTGTTIEHEKILEDFDPVPYEQVAEYCKLPNNYSIYKSTFSGHEWSEHYQFILKDSHLFIGILEGGAEACFYENYVYFDEKGEVLKVVQKVNECDAGDQLKETTNLAEDEKKRIVEGMKEYYEKTKKIIS